MAIAIDRRAELKVESSSDGSRAFVLEESDDDGDVTWASSSSSSLRSINTASQSDVADPLPRLNEPSTRAPALSAPPSRERVRKAPPTQEPTLHEPSAVLPSLPVPSAGQPPPRTRTIAEWAAEVMPDRTPSPVVQSLLARAPDMQQPRAAPVTDARATPTPARDMQSSPEPLPPAPALPAPIAAFIAAHGTGNDLSRLVERYDWQVLDHSGVAGRSAVTAAAWPLGLPQLVKPLWTEYALTRDTLWDKCFDAAETGQVFVGCVAGRGTAGGPTKPLFSSFPPSFLWIIFVTPSDLTLVHRLADVFSQLAVPNRAKPTHVANIRPRLGVDVHPPLCLLGRLTPLKRYPFTVSLTPQYTLVDLAVTDKTDIVALGIGSKQIHFMFPPTVSLLHPRSGKERRGGGGGGETKK